MQLARVAEFNALLNTNLLIDEFVSETKDAIERVDKDVEAAQSGARDSSIASASLWASKRLMDQNRRSFDTIMKSFQVHVSEANMRLRRLHFVVVVALIGSLGLGGWFSRKVWIERARLRESLATQRAIWESAGDALFLFDTETRQLLDTNVSGERLLGLCKDEIVGRYWTDFVPPEQIARDRLIVHAYRLSSGGFLGIMSVNKELAHDAQARRSLA